MRNLGARIVKVPFDAAWRAMDERAFAGVEGSFIHPFDDHNFVAGNASLGLEILEDLPEVRTVIAAIGGGGALPRFTSAHGLLPPQSMGFRPVATEAAPAAQAFAVRAPHGFYDA